MEGKREMTERRNGRLPRLRRLAFRGGLVLGGSFLVLLLVEGALRVAPQLFPRTLQKSLEKGRHEMALKRVFTGDPRLGIKIRPRSDLLVEGPFELRYRMKTYLDFSDAGFRGNVKGRPLLGVAVGDAFTFGVGVEAPEAWPEQLSQLAGKNVANLGVPGHGPPQYTSVLTSYGLTLRPKIVLYALSQDELEDSFCFGLWVQGRGREEYRCPPEARSPSRIGRFFATRSALYQIFQSHFSREEPRRADPEGQTPDAIRFEMGRIKGLLTPEAIEPAWKLAEFSIRTAKQTAKKAGATLVLLLLPSKEQAYWHLVSRERADAAQYDLDRFNRLVKQLCREIDLRCLDLTPLFQEYARQGRQPYFRLDGNWNHEGHRLAARTIYDYLVKNRLLQGANQKVGGKDTTGR